MADNLTPEDRRKTMQAVKSKKTKLERTLFAMLAGMRLTGWRQNVTDITGKPDVVFSREKIAIFVDGCFWHGCPLCQRKMPQTNQQYWKTKISRNIEIAKSHAIQLYSNGWKIIRIWEHDMNSKASRQKINIKIRQALLQENYNGESRIH